MARVPNRHVPPRQQRLHPRLPSGLPPVAGGKVDANARPLAFYALCAADPAAWIASDLVLCIPFFRHILRQDYRYLIK